MRHNIGHSNLYDMIKTDYSMNAAESNVHQNTSWSNKSLHLSNTQIK